MDILTVIDALDDVVHQARPVPMSKQVRIDPDAFLPHMRTIRSEATRLRVGHVPHGRLFEEHVAALEQLWEQARPMPFGDQRRVEKEQVYDVLDQLRATIPEAIREARIAQLPRIDVAGSGAPSLSELVDRLAEAPDGHGLLLSRDGEVVARVIPVS